MRITCPLCGARDHREFTYKGAALLVPQLDAGVAAWDAHVHMRQNPAGPHEELWQHSQGCGAWLRVRRNTATHEMLGVELAQDAGLSIVEDGS